MPECDCGPWIKLSMYGIGTFSSKTGELLSVTYPSRFCMTMAPLVDGRIGDHDGVVAMLSLLPCPWIGVRVIDDTADFVPDPPTQARQS